MAHPKVQFCPKGHDTFIVGRNKWYECIVCAAYVPHPPHSDICSKGHDRNVVGREKNGACTECHKISNKKWKNDNSEKIKKEALENYYNNKDVFRNRQLINTYNITLDDYNKLLKKQNGCCFICGRSGLRKNLGVDHDHKCCPGKKSCGKCIRGLLCNVCNGFLGTIKDDISILEKSIFYIKRT